MSNPNITPAWLASAQQDFIGSHQPYTRRIAELENEVSRLQMELDASCNAEEMRQVRERVKELEGERDRYKGDWHAGAKVWLEAQHASLIARVAELEAERNDARRHWAYTQSIAANLKLKVAELEKDGDSQKIRGDCLQREVSLWTKWREEQPWVQEIAGYQKQVAELEKDGERLAKAAEEVLESYIIGKRVEAGHPCPENMVKCRELRAAISAARAKEGTS